MAEDRAKVIAYTMERALICTLCGSAEWQWEEDSNAFEAVPQTCPGCQRKDWAREDNPEMGQQAGVTITLMPRAVWERIRDTPRRMPRRKRRQRE